jgi:hypothetical protein
MGAGGGGGADGWKRELLEGCAAGSAAFYAAQSPSALALGRCALREGNACVGGVFGIRGNPFRNEGRTDVEFLREGLRGRVSQKDGFKVFGENHPGFCSLAEDRLPRTLHQAKSFPSETRVDNAPFLNFAKNGGLQDSHAFRLWLFFERRGALACGGLAGRGQTPGTEMSL